MSQEVEVILYTLPRRNTYAAGMLNFNFWLTWI